MREIKKKTWPELFEKILQGKKKFDVRLADFGLEEGDVLVLEEYDPEKKEYTGRSIKKMVGFVLDTKIMEKMCAKEDIDKYGFYVIQMEDVE